MPGEDAGTSVDAADGGDAGAAVVPDAGEYDAASWGQPGPVPDLRPPCNGWPELCDRAYDRLITPVSHAAMANLAPSWLHPAQRRTLRQQLDDSMRGLMLEVHPFEGESSLCLGDCSEGHSPLAAGLREIEGFLADNPREVLTLFIDNHIGAPELAARLDEAGLMASVYAGEPGPSWPTLAQLIEAGTRLVVFVSDATGAPPGLRAWWESMQATRDDARELAELNCDLVRGPPGSGLILVQHFLVSEQPGQADAGEPKLRPSESLSTSANRDPGLSARLQTCTQEWGRSPTFVAADFYDSGDLVAAVQRANGLIR
jgi:hypothetical protein